MAEVIARRHMAERGWTHLEVRSAGVGAWDGSPASGGALRAAAAMGLDLSGHRSTFMSSELVDSSDLILTMSASHLQRAFELQNEVVDVRHPTRGPAVTRHAQQTLSQHSRLFGRQNHIVQ